ncbi:MAG: hypothetical protein PHV59_07310, partial [Victivallales bacterium]|nr:hypothetical protein [Victivallales bacterium]
KTVKLVPGQKGGGDKLKPVVDPLTQRDAETGPLDVMADTRTRKTVKLKSITPVKPEISTHTESREENKEAAEADNAPKVLADTSTRKTLKLKPVNPAEKKPQLKLGGSGGGTFKETSTRKTLKLKPLTPESSSPTVSQPVPSVPAENLDDTTTRKTVTAPIQKSEIPPAPEAKAPVAEVPEAEVPEAEVPEEAASEDTIKIQRPASKPDAMPLPSLGAPAAAKAVNSKDTVKLHIPPANGSSADTGTKTAAKETIKLSPKEPAPETVIPEDGGTAINLKLEVPKSKLTLGKVVQPKTPEPETAVPEDGGTAVNPELNTEEPKSKLTLGKVPPPKTPVPAPDEGGEAAPPSAPGGGLKLKTMAPKAEAPRTAVDQEKIKEMRISRGGAGQASPLYTLVAVIAVILVAFCTLVTAVQYFNFWNKQAIGGNPIELPIMKDLKK